MTTTQKVDRRPPKAWFYGMLNRMSTKYPRRSRKRIERIVSGIWWNYPEDTRERLREGYANPTILRPDPSIAVDLPCPVCKTLNPTNHKQSGIFTRCKKCGASLIKVRVVKRKSSNGS